MTSNMDPGILGSLDTGRIDLSLYYVCVVDLTAPHSGFRIQTFVVVFGTIPGRKFRRLGHSLVVTRRRAVHETVRDKEAQQALCVTQTEALTLLPLSNGRFCMYRGGASTDRARPSTMGNLQKLPPSPDSVSVFGDRRQEWDSDSESLRQIVFG